MCSRSNTGIGPYFDRAVGALGMKPQASTLKDAHFTCNGHSCHTAVVQELGIKHPLHRKKLQLALQSFGSEEEDNKGKLDYNWVTSE